jgi:hypothetical protein
MLPGSHCSICNTAPPATPPAAALRTHVKPAPPISLEPLEPSAPLEPSELLESSVVTLPPTSNLLSKVLNLAREIRKDKHWIGYSAFLCFSILNSLRTFAWQGASCIDLVATFAAGFIDHCHKSCPIDVVVCCQGRYDEDKVPLHEVSEEYPLEECNHYLAAARKPVGGGRGVGLQGFYNDIGRILLPTITNGNCGIDVMCQMKGIPATRANIELLRIEISDFVISKASEPWLHDLMVATRELTQDELNAFRASNAQVGGSSAEGMEERNPQNVAERADELAIADRLITAEQVEAISWRTGLKDAVSVRSLVRVLPEAVVEDVVTKWKTREQMSVAEPSPKQCKIAVDPRYLQSRMQVAKEFDAFLTANGMNNENARIPRNSGPLFIKTRLLVDSIKSLTKFRRSLFRWHLQWRRDSRQHAIGPKGRRAPVIRKKHLQNKVVAYQRRQRDNSGRPHSSPWLRVALYEWWTSLRYSIDWEAVKTSFGKQAIKSGLGQRKALARYSAALLRKKAGQLQQDYCEASLIAGVPPRHVVQVTSHWLKRWEAEYGLSMRKANRKYKVPRRVMEERCEITWLNMVKIRYYILLVFGYDPPCENFDQSPFYSNEQGSLNMGTLAVAGGLVPLIENHSDTRSRWTANLTTFSSKERLTADGPPYAEFAFKGGSDIQLRLRKFVEKRGFGKWLTVRTTSSASYKEEDILDFLATHLPKNSNNPQWRIIIADDFSAHKTQRVFDLCFSRGYILIVLGGGITPVLQTCDTDLNQAVKREYIQRETEVLIQQMQDGITVPSCTPEDCIEMMADVLQNMDLHYAAAEGYKKTGLTVALDGSEDHMIVREASVFFRERDMRRKITHALEFVKTEYDAGRLPWSRRSVKRLIQPFPTHAKIDAVLKNIENDSTALEDGEVPYVDDDVVSNTAESDNESTQSVVDENEAWELDGDPNRMLEDDGVNASDVCDAGTNEDDEATASLIAVAEESEKPDDNAIAKRNAEEHIEHSASVICVFEEVIEKLKDTGQMSAVVQMENVIKKERRRVRMLAQEDSNVVTALIRKRNEEAAIQRKRVRELEIAKEQARTRKDLALANKKARLDIHKRKLQLRDLEALANVRMAAKTFTLEALGHGASGSYGSRHQTKARNNRFALMDRMKTLGSGLSAGQLNDFAWFKESWDKKHWDEFEGLWPETFMQYLQHVIDRVDGGERAAFSNFVHSETERCFCGEKMIRI